MKRILIINGLHRKALVAARLLGKAGYVVGITGDSTFTSAFFSKYTKKTFITASSEKNPQAFINDIIFITQKYHYDLLLPMEDPEIRLLSPLRNELSPAIFPFVDDSLLQKTFDKSWVLQKASEIGIAIPKTHFITELSQLDSVIEKINFPWVIKPRVGLGAQGIIYGTEKEELYTNYLHIHKTYPFPLIQEKINGQQVGTGYLFSKNSEVIARFGYRRLRSYPISGGASTFRESWFHQTLLQQGEKLLHHLRWQGVASVEFRIDERDQSFRLMEINPRFWSCQALSAFSGVPFPLLLAKQSLGEDITPIYTFPSFKRGRWLVGEILHFLSHPHKLTLFPEFFSFPDKNTEIDEWDRTDIRGFIGILSTTFVLALSPKNWKYISRGKKVKKPLPRLLTLGKLGYVPFSAALATLHGMLLSVFGSVFFDKQLLIVVWLAIFCSVLVLFAFKKVPDDSEIVVDEWLAGILLGLFAQSLLIGSIIFIVFRFLDSMKPFPISEIEKKLNGIGGILFDDFFIAVIIIVITLILIF